MLRNAIAAVVGSLVGLLAAIVIGAAVAAYVWRLAAGELVDDPVRAAEQDQPSQRARALAESVSRGMNVAATATIVTMPLGAIWFVRRSRRPKAEVRGERGGR